jgi:hypothetical protein
MGDYYSAVKEAQKAVEFIQDEKLREIDFSQVLQDILSSREVKKPRRESLNKNAAAEKPMSRAAWLFV